MISGNLPSWPITTLGLIFSYSILCRFLRFRRMRRKHAQYPYATRESYAKMTADDAFEIAKYCFTLEFPFTTEKAAQFALFRSAITFVATCLYNDITYGIPSISKLLCETQQLSEPVHASKRYADTVILINEFILHPPTSDRAISAISRMNYLHSVYQKAGKISNDDMLYTLSLFILETYRFIKLYEWRCLTPMEVCAIGTHWKNIGDAMGISFAPLDSGPSNFSDGLMFTYELRRWAESYEREYMVPSNWNHKLANETVAILIYNIPGFLKAPAKKVVAALMDERLRKAMMFPEPPRSYVAAVHALIAVRSFFLRNFALPRPYFLRFTALSEQPDKETGRYHRLFYETEPWYIPETLYTRYSPSAWLRWIAGRPIPGGQKYKPEGYHMHEIGPSKMEGKGMEAYEEGKERLLKQGRGKCPFAFAGA
ncbi:hypothetical protein K432DRAFT_297294 [Lepidopterella palustris CBS 459.81]|uniref:ER-bound oxygenase mpaB/mpaB'/Rubber oxygenase catalytic domain-containing protein n=1 Tax=Lepidopterella palustris CBS 459.81 TaxID=1314670 RepID=A0A8E2JFE0_9PEZI|nr:hypothetical protein K432DRAFT_297294 [Lepidopterella palustris CBS 459.81]